VKIDVTPFKKAIETLQRGIIRSTSLPEDEELRDAVIQRFEYSMDLSWKLIQRYLKNAGMQDSDFRTKRDLFREAARIGLITAPEKWFAYHEARNATSHTYNSEIANQVYQNALRFFNDALALLHELEKPVQDEDD
jgi:nucleotidyltransferase substrate binding protein (TIGR01987 family)